MRTKSLLLLILLCGAILASCKSREDRAAELIRQELSKTLYDFGSYEPIETTVTEAYETAYNTPGCFGLAMAIVFEINEFKEAVEAVKDAGRRAEIWGAPTYYSSSYSDNQYYKHMEEVKEQADKATKIMSVVMSMGQTLQDSIANLDGSKQIGWDVKHRFRCKTRGGQATIGDYRYIISKDFKTILLREDIDDDDYKQARDVIEEALAGHFSESKDDTDSVVEEVIG